MPKPRHIEGRHAARLANEVAQREPVRMLASADSGGNQLVQTSPPTHLVGKKAPPRVKKPSKHSDVVLAPAERFRRVCLAVRCVAGHLERVRHVQRLQRRVRPSHAAARREAWLWLIAEAAWQPRTRFIGLLRSPRAIFLSSTKPESLSRELRPEVQRERDRDGGLAAIKEVRLWRRGALGGTEARQNGPCDGGGAAKRALSSRLSRCSMCGGPS